MGQQEKAPANLSLIPSTYNTENENTPKLVLWHTCTPHTQ